MRPKYSFKIIALILLLIGLQSSGKTEAQSECGFNSDTLFDQFQSSQLQIDSYLSRMYGNESYSNDIARATLSIPNVDPSSMEFYQRLEFINKNVRFFLRDSQNQNIMIMPSDENLISPQLKYLRTLIIFQIASSVESAEDLEKMFNASELDSDIDRRAEEYKDISTLLGNPSEISDMKQLLGGMDYKLNIVFNVSDDNKWGHVALTDLPTNTLFFYGVTDASYVDWSSENLDFLVLKYPFSIGHELDHLLNDVTDTNVDGTLTWNVRNEDGIWYNMTEEERNRFIEYYNQNRYSHIVGYIKYAFSDEPELLPVLAEIMREKLTMIYYPNSNYCQPDSMNVKGMLDTMVGIFGTDSSRWAEILSIPHEAFSEENLIKITSGIPEYQQGFLEPVK